MESRPMKIGAVMTAPRFEITWCRTHIETALRALKIPLSVSGGVFYGQCMQIMLTRLMDAGCDYAVTVDFDSLFTSSQLLRLISQIEQRPEIDAICGLQVRRGKPSMLGTVVGGDDTGNGTKQVKVDGSPILAETAHFGLTVIDMKKLAGVPKPWFMATPNADGEWDGEKVDDDVYFWKQWKKAGNTIYFDPGVRLGHVEEMVVMHDETFTPHHIYPQDWEAWSLNS